jgi:hypothetical protein
MGNTVVADASICYLVSNHDDEIFIIPRQYLEPKLRDLLPQLTTLPYGATDDRALEYLSMTPWGGYLKKRVEKYISIEEKVRVLMVQTIGGLPKTITLPKSQIEKADELWFPLENIKISKDFNYQKFGAKQLINFLEAFCWVSKAYSCECLEIGNGRDFEFQIYEKSSLSFLGTKGKVVLLFRWSEFNYISIENLTRFTINTLDKNWGASMGNRGFPKVI